VKLNNLTITPKLGILVGMTLFGLCIAGALAGYLMQREMLDARLDQIRSIVDVARNMAIGLQKQVDAGQLTKEAALAEFGRRANTMTYDNGAGYLFGTNYDGITVLAPDPRQIGTNRMDLVVNGRMISHELLDGVKAKGEVLLTYEYVRPGEERPVRKISYATAIPGWDMFVGSGAYLDDLDAKLKPMIWVLGLAILIIAVLSGGIAWLVGRSISRPLDQLGARMRGLADGELDAEIPGTERGDEVGAMAATVQIFKDNALRIRGHEKIEVETRQRAAAERRATMDNIANDFERSVKGIVSSVATAAAGNADHRAIHDRNRERRQRARRDRRGGIRQRLEQCWNGRCGRRRAVQLGRRDLPAGDAVEQHRRPGGRRCRAHQRHRQGVVDRSREDR
jgi:methyl-accepting chemotaxis protein